MEQPEHNPWQAPQSSLVADSEAQEPAEPVVVAEPQLRRVLSIARSLVNHRRGAVGWTWGLICAVSLLSTGLNAGGGILMEMSAVGWVIYIGASIIVGLAMAGLYVASMAPLHEAYFGRADLTAGEVISVVMLRLAPGLGIYVLLAASAGLAVAAVGAVATLASPVLWIFALPVVVVLVWAGLPMVYLVGSGQAEVFEAVTMGFGWAKRHWGILLVVQFAAGLAFFALAQMAGVAVGAEGMQAMQDSTEPVIIAVRWGLGAVGGFFVWLVLSATMLAIDERETQRSPQFPL